MISSCSANPDHCICICSTLDRLGAGLSSHHKKQHWKSQRGLMGHGSNTGACRVWCPTSGRSTVLDDTICYSHQLFPSPSPAHQCCPATRSTIPLFNCCPRQRHIPTMLLERANLPVGLTDNLTIGHLLGWITRFFPLYLIKTLPWAGQGFVPHSTRQADPALLLDEGILPSLQMLRQKPLHITKAKLKYSLPCSSLHFINGVIYSFPVS